MGERRRYSRAMTADDGTSNTGLYRHPYPSPELAARHAFVELEHDRLSTEEMAARCTAFRETLDRRRSVRMFSDEPIPADIIETAIMAASSAPSGAHRQPWRFVMTNDPDLKRRIRLAAEEEERTNYLENRMNDEWQEALAPLGTDHHKEFLEIAPWIVVLFEERFGVANDGSKIPNYYVKESCGIAAGFFIAALHMAGLCTLTHTPTPMRFLNEVLERPDNERPFVLFPVGRPLSGTQVPDIRRKRSDEVIVRRGA